MHDASGFRVQGRFEIYRALFLLLRELFNKRPQEPSMTRATIVE